MSDPYLYKDSNVLKNKLGTKKIEKLEQFESATFQIEFAKMRKTPFKIKSALDILKIHKSLFGSVFEWAGMPRIINIEKREAILNGLSVIYEDKMLIKEKLKALDNDLSSLTNDNFFIKNLAWLISSLWQIHPFREGNTRTVTVFLYLYLKKYNINLNFSFLKDHSSFFRNSLVLAPIGEYSEYNYLEEILADVVLGNKSKKEYKETNINKYEKNKEFINVRIQV